MTKTISDFSKLDLSPEFVNGSNTILVQSQIAGVRSGVALTPLGVAPVGLSVYNSDSITDYGFVDLLIHPEIPDTLLLTSRNLGSGVKPSIINSDLYIRVPDPVNPSDVVNKNYVDNSLNNSTLVKFSATVPLTVTSIGVAGNISFDSNYLYVCISTNSWKRISLTTW